MKKKRKSMLNKYSQDMTKIGDKKCLILADPLSGFQTGFKLKESFHAAKLKYSQQQMFHKS